MSEGKRKNHSIFSEQCSKHYLFSLANCNAVNGSTNDAGMITDKGLTKHVKYWENTLACFNLGAAHRSV